MQHFDKGIVIYRHPIVSPHPITASTYEHQWNRIVYMRSHPIYWQHLRHCLTSAPPNLPLHIKSYCFHPLLLCRGGSASPILSEGLITSRCLRIKGIICFQRFWQSLNLSQRVHLLCLALCLAVIFPLPTPAPCVRLAFVTALRLT